MRSVLDGGLEQAQHGKLVGLAGLHGVFNVLIDLFGDGHGMERTLGYESGGKRQRKACSRGCAPKQFGISAENTARPNQTLGTSQRNNFPCAADNYFRRAVLIHEDAAATGCRS